MFFLKTVYIVKFWKKFLRFLLGHRSQIIKSMPSYGKYFLMLLSVKNLLWFAWNKYFDKYIRQTLKYCPSCLSISGNILILFVF